MSLIERVIQVTYHHRVFFTRDVFSPVNRLLEEVMRADSERTPTRVLLTLDESLSLAQPALAKRIESYFAAFPNLELVCPPMPIEGGERAKNSYFHVSEIQSRIQRHGICRHSYVVAVGGGAHLDVVGLAAATAHRGVRHIRIPTTTLAQDDSGVGVKNGINSFGKKNFIGTFAPPFAVINDFELLGSLPARDKRAGFVEAVKVALIRDAEFFGWIEQNASRLATFEPTAMEDLIRRCAELHVQHIASSGDPFEFGSARPLDFGHWAAHKLEQLSEYRIRHGEGVAIGIALDVVYARRRSFLSPAAAKRVLDLLEALGFELFANELLHRDSADSLMILGGLDDFREHLGGQLTITLLNDLGVAREVHEMHLPTVIESINELAERHQQRVRITSAPRSSPRPPGP